MRHYRRDFLAGQIVVVTGGAQGIGWAITQACAAHGAEVYVCDILRAESRNGASSTPRSELGRTYPSLLVRRGGS